MTAAVYLFVSLLALFSVYLLSVYCSGDNYSWKWFGLIFLLNVLIGMFHGSVFEHDYEVLIPALTPILKGNEVVQWIAFASLLLQVRCLPKPYDSRRWRLRKKVVKERRGVDYIRKL